MMDNEQAIPQPLLEEPRTNEFVEYWRIVVRHRLLIAILTIVGMFVGTIYYSSLPETYKSEVKILINKPDLGLKSYEKRFFSLFIDQDANYYGTQMEILTGRPIREQVNTDLELLPGTYRVEADRLSGTRIIVLSVWDKSPEMASKVANKFAEVFIREHQKESLFVPQQILKFLPEESEIVSGFPQQIEDLDKTEFAKSLSAVNNDLVIQKLESEKWDIDTELRELSQKYKGGHPAIKTLKERLEDTQEQLNQRTKQIIKNLRADLKGKFQVTHMRVLEKAEPSTVPLKPNVFRGLFLGFLCGFLTGTFIAVARERSVQRIRTEDDIHSATKVLFLGAIPWIKELSKLHKRYGRFRLAKDFSVVTFFKHNKVISDSIANVRTHVLFSMEPGKAKTLLVTSTLPSEGKTMTASLLALSLAGLGEKVLLIDADMREPFVHKYFKLKNEKGLLHFLKGEAALEDIVTSVPDTRVKIITAGGSVSNSSELLTFKRFRELLSLASENFDRIIIDVPPSLYIPDGLIASAYVDGVLLICRSYKVDRRDFVELIEKFNSLNRHLVGVILDGVDLREYHSFKLFKKYYQDRQ